MSALSLGLLIEDALFYEHIHSDCALLLTQNIFVDLKQSLCQVNQTNKSVVSD